MTSTSATTTAAAHINTTTTPTAIPVLSVPPPTVHRDWATGAVEMQHYEYIPGCTVKGDDDTVPLLLEASTTTWYVVDWSRPPMIM